MKKLIPAIMLLCFLCGCQKEAVCEHQSAGAATCSSPERCELCGEELAPSLPHTPVCTDCEVGTFCSVCGEKLADGKPHSPGEEATCTTVQLCTVCGKELAPVREHEPSGSESCTEDVVCTLCGEVLIPAAHVPEGEATCTDPQYCSRCGQVLQSALGHEAGPAATATEPQVCTRCGVVMAPAFGVSGGIVEQTVSGGHYHETVSAYLSGNVLVCGDYAMEYFWMDEAGCSPWAAAVNSFAERFPDVHTNAILIPKCCAYHAPAGYTNQADNLDAFIHATYGMLSDTITAVDVTGVFREHSGEYLFYRTDHHWTSLGAYYASAAYCQANGIQPRALDSYETTLRTGYIGSLYSFCAEPPACLLVNPDYTVCHLPACSYTMEYNNGSGWSEGPMLYTETNSYSSAFLCGDNGLTRITTDQNNGRALLVFKESYGNAFVPFMADYFQTIIVVDIRQQIESVAALVEEYGITDAVFINNVQAAESYAGSIAARAAS